eukprot:scaffold130061_cov65-Phaeocystis_antarctica.AAC.5
MGDNLPPEVRKATHAHKPRGGGEEHTLATAFALAPRQVAQQLTHGRWECVDGDERLWMPIAKGLALPHQRLAQQRLSGGEVALALQERAKVVDGDDGVLMTTAERLALHLHRLAKQWLSGGEVTLVHQQ